MTANETDPENVLRSRQQVPHQTSRSKRNIKFRKRTKTLLVRLLLIGIYTTSGAAIFRSLESGNENQKSFCHTEGESEVETQMANKFNVSMLEVRKIIEDLCAMFEGSHRCKYSHNDWSYYQSLYFVGSVITTIGYGHLAPKTQYGRLFLIFYAFFGIPINLLTLQSIGEHMNLFFHYLIACTENKLYKSNRVCHEHIKTFVLSVVLMILILPLGGTMYYFSERETGWTFLDSVYYTFVALSTIGFGDLVPNEGKEPNSTYERVMWCVRLLFIGLGLSLVSSVFTSVSSATKQMRSAYLSKKGKYDINPNNSKEPSYNNTTKQSILNFKELLCNSNVQHTSGDTASTPRETYSLVEDTMSTTSTHSHNNPMYAGLSDQDHEITFTQDTRYRSISMALGHAHLGADNNKETDSCILMRERRTSSLTRQDVADAEHHTNNYKPKLNDTGNLGNPFPVETNVTEDPDRLNQPHNRAWTKSYKCDMMVVLNNEAIAQIIKK